MVVVFVVPFVAIAFCIIWLGQSLVTLIDATRNTKTAKTTVH